MGAFQLKTRASMSWRSLAPLVKTRGFEMTRYLSVSTPDTGVGNSDLEGRA